MWFVPEPGGRPRFAWAVGRKVGGAVVRNRLRRRLREVVEALARSGSVAPGAYLVSVSPDAVHLSFDELKENVAATLRAAGSGSGPDDRSDGRATPPASPRP